MSLLVSPLVFTGENPATARNHWLPMPLREDSHGL